MDSAWKTHMAPPLSLLVLGALTPPEHKVTLEDENVEPLHLNDQPDLVGITVKVDTAPRAAAIAAQYRRRGVSVVVGGIHPTVCPEDCARFADAVVIGEAETLWPQLLDDVGAGCLHPVYRNTSRVDIARVPGPRWDLLQSNRYLFTNTLTIGRGCPWRCDFCYNSSRNIDAGYRMKPIAHILEEIQSLGTQHVMFIDDNFIGDPEKIRRLLRKLMDRDLIWHAAVSTDIGRHDDILDMMGNSGCKSLFIGFETLNAANLVSAHKAQNRIEYYNSTIAKINQRGIMVNASMVFGFDGDDTTVFPATLDWLVYNRIASMTAHILTPYPGTRLYARLQAEGRIIDNRLDHYNTAHVVFQPARMTACELEQGYRSIYNSFYSWENIWRRWPAIDGQRVAYLEFNILYRKFGKALSHIGLLYGMRGLADMAKRLAYGSGQRRKDSAWMPWPARPMFKHWP